MGVRSLLMKALLLPLVGVPFCSSVSAEPVDITDYVQQQLNEFPDKKHNEIVQQYRELHPENNNKELKYIVYKEQDEEKEENIIKLVDLEKKILDSVEESRKNNYYEKGERVAFLAYDINKKEYLVDINSDVKMQCASMAKVFAMSAYFIQVEKGKLKYTKEDQKFMKEMIRSDRRKGDRTNQAFNRFVKKVGGPAAVQELLTTKYPGIFINIDINEYIPLPSERTYKNMASAKDYMRFLIALKENKLPYSKKMLELMNRLDNDEEKLYAKGGLTARQAGVMRLHEHEDCEGKKYSLILVSIIDKDKRANFKKWKETKQFDVHYYSNLMSRYFYNEYGLNVLCKPEDKLSKLE
ncbi:serine hydrolase [Nanoarchaeota archaeon]